MEINLKKGFIPETAQHYDYFEMTLSSDEATKIEEATRRQGVENS